MQKSKDFRDKRKKRDQYSNSVLTLIRFPTSIFFVLLKCRETAAMF